MTGLLKANPDALRRLAALGGGPVLSLYASLDDAGAHTAETRRQELQTRLKEAEGQLRKGVEAGAAKPLEAATAGAREAIEEVPLDDHALRAVALFVPAAGEPLAIALERPIETPLAASFAARAAIEPMLEALEGESWAVVLVSRSHGRVFRGNGETLVEIADVDDDVHRWHSQGGWSQSRYQRGVEKEAADHVGRVCDLLFALHERRPLDRLVLGGPEEILPQVESKLHPYLRERLAGRIRVDVEDASVAEVVERLRPLVAERRAQAGRQAIERLEAGLGTGDEAVAGAEEVAAALRDRRVETLLLSGAATGGPTERAAEEALAQDAEVLVFESEELERFGGIAALLRF